MLPSKSFLPTASMLCLLVVALTGCGSLPTAKVAAPPTPERKVTAHVTLLADSKLSEVVNSTTTHPAITVPPYKYNFFADLQPAISESGFSSWFSHLTVCSPDQSASADLFLLPQVKRLHLDYPMMSYNDTKVTLDLGVSFLDANRVPIFESVSTATANVNIANPSRLAKAAHVAFLDSFSGVASQLTGDARAKFVLDHLQFFNGPDADKRAALPQLLTDASTREKIAPTLLAYSIRGNYSQLFDVLLSQGVSPNLRDSNDSLTPIHIAALYGRPELITKLVAAGASAAERDAENHLPIFYAAWAGRDDSARRLLDLNSGADVFVSEMPITSLQKMTSFGDYCAAQWNKEHARACYGLALEYAKRTAAESKSEAKKLKRQTQLAWVGVILVGAVQGAAQEYTVTSQQRQMARDFAQVQAMRQATEAGTGFTGYVHAMHAANTQMARVANSQSVTIVLNRWQPPEAEVQALSANPKVREKAMLALSAQADAQIELLGKRIDALEKAQSFTQFKSLLPGDALQP